MTGFPPTRGERNVECRTLPTRPNGSSKFQVNVVLRAFAVQAEGLKHHSPGQRPGSAGAKGVVIPFPCQALKGRDRCFAPTGLRSFLRSAPPGAVPQAGPSQAFGLSCPYLELGTLNFLFPAPLCYNAFCRGDEPGSKYQARGCNSLGHQDLIRLAGVPLSLCGRSPRLFLVSQRQSKVQGSKSKACPP